MHERLIVYHYPDHFGGKYKLIKNPTIGEVRLARRNGALILRKTTAVRGNVICSAWITDAGKQFVVQEKFSTP